jgi:hypothetical protein
MEEVNRLSVSEPRSPQTTTEMYKGVFLHRPDNLFFITHHSL